MVFQVKADVFHKIFSDRCTSLSKLLVDYFPTYVKNLWFIYFYTFYATFWDFSKSFPSSIAWRPTLRKKCPNSELFWSVYSCIRTKYREIFRISPCSVWTLENTDQNNSEYKHFSRGAILQWIMSAVSGLESLSFRSWSSRAKVFYTTRVPKACNFIENGAATQVFSQ